MTIHDTAVDGHTPFNANTLAKAADGTPFKRPENGRFRPGTGFREFYFDETGDTNATSPENDERRAAGARSSSSARAGPGASSARLSIFYRCDGTRAGFDNTSFLSHDLVTFVEDAGDGLHGQRNALDSGWVFDVTQDYSDPSNQPVRWLAEGRDPSATIDAAAGGFGKNDGDNEITGTDVSDGDTTVHGLLGSEEPAPLPGQGLALLLHRAARGQPHVRGRPGSVAPPGQGPRTRRGPCYFRRPTARRRGRS